MSSSDEAEFDANAMESESDDEPLANLASPDRRRSGSKPVSYADDDSDDDSDDDIPLSALVSTKKSPKKKAPAKKKTPVKKKKPTKTTKPKTSSSDTKKKYDSKSAALYGLESTKGLLIQRLLCRWWYAITWPAELPGAPPANHDALDGFPGVYVCTAGDNVGTILDTRDKATCPSFQNFVQKDAQDLKELLIQALEGQKKELVANEGSGTPTETEINKLIKWATKVNPKKAEKEAATIIKAQL